MEQVRHRSKRTELWDTILVLGATACLLFRMVTAQPAAAQELPKEAVLPLSLANKAVVAAIESCKKDGYRVSASVVDRSGVLRAMGRADGAGPHTVDSSRKKAYTAASIRRPTTELADLISKNPALQGLRDMNDEILILGGGLPIEIGGEIVGGIGVGGAPGAHLDDACAQSGLDAIGAAPKVTVPK
ncbi:MAG: heme-binding protein [Nitrospira sp.]|nr:heme-binding protein [Nitrospira sp.]MCP9441010.1 heme-binding protein [Nitrospira sp.]